MDSRYKISYAQNYEDVIIEAFFPDVSKGFYVDIGANHPFFHSVTKLFYDQGWIGINIEPNPKLFRQIQRYRRRDTNLQHGVGASAGKVQLRIYHSIDGLEGISTISDDMKSTYSERPSSDTSDFEDIVVDVVPLKKVFKEQKIKKIHFMKVDVEGYEYEVIAGNDWERYRPELLCIEANHILKDWRPLLKNAKYNLVFNDGLNNYYLSEEAMYRVDKFDYARVFLGENPVLPFGVTEEIRVAREGAKILSQEKISLLKGFEAEKKRSERLAHELESITPLRKHIKRQVKQRIRHLRGKKH